MVRLEVTSATLQSLEAERARADPEECCGLLLGQGDCVRLLRPAANVSADPARRFEIDPVVLIDAHRAARAGGPEVIGYYHSHPTGPAALSAADRAMAAGDGKVWAIIGADGVTFWRDEPAGFAPLPYVVEDR